MFLTYYCFPLFSYIAHTVLRLRAAGLFKKTQHFPTPYLAYARSVFLKKMAPSKAKQGGRGGRGAARGRGTNVGPANQASSSSEAASQGLAPAIPNFQTPTLASQARSGASAPPQDVVAPPQDVTMEDTTTSVDPRAEVPALPMDLEYTVPPPPAPVVALPPAVPAPAELTMQVQSLLAALPSPLSKEEQTKLKMANIRARIKAKRRRPDSSDDSVQPSAAKKQQTEKPGEQQIFNSIQHILV